MGPQKSNHYHIHPSHLGAIINTARPHQGQDVKPAYCRNALKTIQETVDYDEE